MIDIILGLSFFLIIMVDAVIIKHIIITTEREPIPYLLDEITMFGFIVWSIRIALVIILIILNVVIFIDTYNDIYFSLANYIIESETFIKE